MIQKKYSDVLTSSVINNLLSNGYVKLPSLRDYIDLDLVSSFLISEIGDKTFTSLSPSHEKLIDSLGLRSDFAIKLHKIAREKFLFKGGVEDQYHISRYVIPGNPKECFRAHFDSHIFTLVLPLLIPTNPNELSSGELLFKAEARRYPKSEFENFLTKLYFKRYANERASRKFVNSGYYSVEKFINMEPLLFLGLTSLHTNAPVAFSNSNPRLTCLAHYFDPSPQFGIGKVLRSIRRR